MSYMKEENCNDFIEVEGLCILKRLLEKNRRIKTHFVENDKTPIIDGFFNLLKGGYKTDKNNKQRWDGTIIRRFDVQVKSVQCLQPNKIGEKKDCYYYRFDTGVLNAVKERVFDTCVIYFVVSLDNEKVFYKIIDQDFLDDFEYDSDSTQATYYFTNDDVLIDIDMFCNMLYDYFRRMVEESYLYASDYMVKKELLEELTSTRNVLMSSLYGFSLNNSKSDESDLNEAFSFFMKNILCDEKFDVQKFNKLKLLILSKTEKTLKKIVGIRLDVLSKYWQGFDVQENLENLLKEAEKSKRIPIWLINNIAIDLRNISNSQIDNYGQKVISKSKGNVYFPLIDRLSSNIKDSCLKKFTDFFAGTRYFGSSKNDYDFNDISKYFCISLLFGSITHLTIVKVLIRDLLNSSYCTNRNIYDIAPLIKMDVLLHDNKHLDTIIDKTSDVMFKHIDFSCILNSIDFLPRQSERDCSKIIMISNFGYVLDDDTFEKIYDWYISFIKECLKDGKKFIDYYTLFRDSIMNSHMRFEKKDLFDIFVESIKSCYPAIRDFGVGIFEYIDLNVVEDEYLDKLKNLIEEYLLDGSCESISFFKEKVVLYFCFSCPQKINYIDEILKEKYTNFYNENVLLNIKENEKDYYISTIKNYIVQIKDELAPKKQFIHTISEDYFSVIKKILIHKNVTLVQEELNEIIGVVKEYLMSKEKRTSIKCSCILLIMYLQKEYPEFLKWKEFVSYLSKNESVVLSVERISPFALGVSNTVAFYLNLLKTLVLNDNNDLLSSFSYVYNFDIHNQVICMKCLHEILINNYSINDQCRLLIVQLAFALSTSKNYNVSYYSILILCDLLPSNNSDLILKHIYSIMPLINYNSRQLVVKHLLKSNIKHKIINEILKEANNDFNYLVKQSLNENS